MHIDVRYVSSTGGTRIAWSMYGSGAGTPLVAMRPPQFSHLEREWRMGFSHHEFEVFIPSRPVVRFDPRGTGLSDRGVADQSIESRLGDLEAVLDGAGIDRVVIDAISSSAMPAILFAIHYPDRVERLILQNLFTDGAALWAAPNRRALLTLASIDWRLCSETFAWLTWPTGDRAGIEALAEHIRACIGPDDLLRMAEAEATTDLRPLLPQIHAPTLVLANPEFARMVPQDVNREAAAAIPSAHLVSVRSARDRIDAIQAFLQDGLLTAPRAHGAPRASPTVAPLSERELEVLRLIAAGFSNREIADQLVLSVRTVDSHAARIYEKTNTRGRAEATAYAVRSGLLEIR